MAEIQRERNPIKNTVVKESSVIGLQPSDIPDGKVYILDMDGKGDTVEKAIARINGGIENIPINTDSSILSAGFDTPTQPTREEELESQNKELADLLHDYQKAHTPDLDEKLSEIQKLRIELDTVTKSRDALQNENNELRRQCEINRKEITKLKKLYIK